MNDVMSLFSRPLRRVLFLFIAFIFTAALLKITYYKGEPEPIAADVAPKSSRIEKALIVSTMKDDNVEWIENDLSDWHLIRYVVDDSSARYTVPRNKGREAMVYLTYLIEHYDHMPDLSVFLHSGRYQWHNDDPLYDGLQMIRSLQIPYLHSQGYTNIRCVWTLGCPGELRELDQQKLADVTDGKDAELTAANYAAAFRELFPGAVVPPAVGVTCCAQFAVTREKVHQRPVEDYIRYRNWLMKTPFPDSVSGRVLEYAWHIIFGKEAVLCPDAKGCYCKLFGLCNLECGKGTCGERWPFPPSATLPEGWPEYGWQGEFRDNKTLEAMKMVAMVKPKEMGKIGTETAKAKGTAQTSTEG